MGNKIRRIFNPTPEEQIDDLNGIIKIMEEAYREYRCSTCTHYIPLPDDLPGFVSAYPDCELGGPAIETCEKYVMDRDKYERERQEFTRKMNELKARAASATAPTVRHMNKKEVMEITAGLNAAAIMDEASVLPKRCCACCAHWCRNIHDRGDDSYCAKFNHECRGDFFCAGWGPKDKED